MFIFSILLFVESISNNPNMPGTIEKIHWSIYAHFCVVSTFLLAWLLVGSVSLWKDGVTCADPNSPIWNAGLAGVIFLIVYFGILLTFGLGAWCGACCVACDYGYDY